MPKKKVIRRSTPPGPKWNFALLAKLKEKDEEAYNYLWNNGEGRPRLGGWKPHASTISEMFSWNSSKQGSDYWHDLHYKIGSCTPPWEL